MHSWEYITLLLNEPFHPNLVSFREGKITRDGKFAKAMAYVDAREYMNKLDDIFGVQHWSVEYRVVGEPTLISTVNEQDKTKYHHTGCVIAKLTIYNSDGSLCITREDLGEAENIGNSFFPTASAQAFKRACSGLGIGRYLYGLPEKFYPINQYKKFEDVEHIRKDLLWNDKNYSIENIYRAQERVLQLMYQSINHKNFVMPKTNILDMNYFDLIEYGKTLKQLIQEG